MNSTQIWYATLIKPSWAPPAWLFGPVWSILYILIAISFGTVFYKVAKGTFPKRLARPLVLNLAFNLMYSPIQFKLQNNYLATLDILLVLGTLIWSLRALWPRLRWAAVANLPYLAWVSFATVLQLTITWLNR